jgi:hypothetical protein
MAELKAAVAELQEEIAALHGADMSIPIILACIIGFMGNQQERDALVRTLRDSVAHGGVAKDSLDATPLSPSIKQAYADHVSKTLQLIIEGSEAVAATKERTSKNATPDAPT